MVNTGSRPAAGSRCEPVLYSSASCQKGGVEEMNLSAPFIIRPIATTLLMIGFTLLGLAAYVLLPIAGVPQVDVPTIRVTAKLPGANAETMATSVAAPLESQLALMSGVNAITSTSSLGQTNIQIEF